MKKYAKFILSAILTMLLLTEYAYAGIGDMGFFGGISKGERLPTTIELAILNSAGSKTSSKSNQMEYKEIIFLNGIPVEFEGLITVNNGTLDTTKEVGTYTVNIIIVPSSTSGNNSINRNITYNVNWRKVGRQIVKDYMPSSWTETVRVGDIVYTLDSRQSNFNVSILEDHTPGVTYYKGTTSGHSVYSSANGGTVVDVSGSFYGYNCAWSRTETHRNTVTVTNDEWQMQYEVRPSVTSNKTMQYDVNEPTAISFSGNYQEILQTESWLQYDIMYKPTVFFDVPDKGNAMIDIPNTFEQLIAPNLGFLKGHFAEQDIARLFSMQILDGPPEYYIPAQAITRGQYTAAIIKATKIPIETVNTTSSTKSNAKNNNNVYVIFPDVTVDRTDYPMIIAAYKAGISIGKDDARFYPDDGLERQEAIAIILRTLGLQNLELDPTPFTPFADDYKIADWARSEIYAAYRLNIIGPDDNGELRPNDIVTKAEAAALINRVIDYMRHDLADDYTGRIAGYTS